MKKKYLTYSITGIDNPVHWSSKWIDDLKQHAFYLNKNTVIRGSSDKHLNLNDIDMYTEFICMDESDKVFKLSIEELMHNANIYEYDNTATAQTIPGVIPESAYIFRDYIENCFKLNNIPYTGRIHILIHACLNTPYSSNIIIESEDEPTDFSPNKDYIRCLKDKGIYVYLSSMNNSYWLYLYILTLSSDDYNIERCNCIKAKIESIQDPDTMNYFINSAYKFDIKHSSNIDVVIYTALGNLRISNDYNLYKAYARFRYPLYVYTETEYIYLYINDIYFGNKRKFIIKQRNDKKPLNVNIFGFCPSGPDPAVVRVYDYNDAKISGLFPNIDSMEENKKYEL